MPNKHYASATTQRANSTASYFNEPTDATPADHKEITLKLIRQAIAVLQGINTDAPNFEFLSQQIELTHSLLVQADNALFNLDFDTVIDLYNQGGIDHE